MSPRQTKTKNWTTTWLLSRYCMKHSWYLASVLSVIKISRGKKTNWSRYGQSAVKKDVFKRLFYLLKRRISLIDQKCLVKGWSLEFYLNRLLFCWFFNKAMKLIKKNFILNVTSLQRVQCSTNTYREGISVILVYWWGVYNLYLLGKQSRTTWQFCDKKSVGDNLMQAQPVK